MSSSIINGILLLNKPVGISSNAALQQAKRLFKARKAGHTGSLDQLASGLLPICFGEATKISAFLLDADKYYVATCTLGITTTTADAEGEITATQPADHIKLADIETVIPQFLGEIQQVPPMYSALKRQGQTLYKLARQGKTVERQPRPVTIHAIDLLNYKAKQLKIAVHCSKGTYIRTLAEDIGQALGCGAYISALHRTQVGQFKHMWDFAQLEQLAADSPDALNALLIAPHLALQHLPQLYLTPTQATQIQYGQAVMLQTDAEGTVCLFDHASEGKHFLGIGQANGQGEVKPKRLLNLSSA